MNTTTDAWTETKWPYNDAPEYRAWKCLQRKVGRGKIILRPSHFTEGEWSYVASFGADDDRSHSGGFPDGFTLDQAKQRIQQQIDNGKYRSHP